MSRFFSRNLVGLKEVAWDIQRAKRKEKPTKNTLLGKDFIRIEEEIKSFPNMQKLKEFITTKLALQEILKGLL